MYSILGTGSFCFNYCLNLAWHGGDQFVALLRWYGNPGFFDSGLQLICIFWSLVSHFPLDRFSMGFRSGEFAGQSSTPTPWSFNQLLEQLLISSVDQPFKDTDFIFQQDLAPAHTAKSPKRCLNDHGVGVLDSSV